MAKNNRLDDFIKQPQRAPSAGDLGAEAYRANLADTPGPDPSPDSPPAGVQPRWNTPKPEHVSHDRDHGDPLKMGRRPM